MSRTVSRRESDCFVVPNDEEYLQPRGYDCLTPYLRKILKEKQPNMTITSLAVHEIDNMLKDIMDKIGGAATDLLDTSGRVTLTPYSLAKAIRLALPTRLSNKSRICGKNALHRYNSSYRARQAHQKNY